MNIRLFFKPTSFIKYCLAMRSQHRFSSFLFFFFSNRRVQTIFYRILYYLMREKKKKIMILFQTHTTKISGVISFIHLRFAWWRRRRRDRFERCIFFRTMIIVSITFRYFPGNPKNYEPTGSVVHGIILLIYARSRRPVFGNYYARI